MTEGRKSASESGERIKRVSASATASEPGRYSTSRVDRSDILSILDGDSAEMRMAQLGQDMRDHRTEFKATLRALLPTLEAIRAEMSSLRAEFSGLRSEMVEIKERIPSRTFFISIVVAAFFALLALSAPKEVWLVILDLARGSTS